MAIKQYADVTSVSSIVIAVAAAIVNAVYLFNMLTADHATAAVDMVTESTSGRHVSVVVSISSSNSPDHCHRFYSQVRCPYYLPGCKIYCEHRSGVVKSHRYKFNETLAVLTFGHWH